MRVSFQVQTVLALFIGLAAAQTESPHNEGVHGIPASPSVTNNVIPNRYIVEFENPENLRKAAPEGNIFVAFYKALVENGIIATPAFNISSDVFEGVSLETTNVTTIEEIKKVEEVKNVWPVRVISRAIPKILEAGENTLPSWTSHTNTGVLDLHSQGIEGEGAIVGVIDTGIDYNHPSLGGGIGPDFKVISGYDVVGDDYKGQGGDFKPDNDPIDTEGHGTHVAGIIAASNDPNFVSVAPKAKLRAIKVFGNGATTTSEDALLAAFVRAYEDGVDVINASIGGPDGWAHGAWAELASRLVDQGVFVVIAAGNEGAVGPWYASSGATGKNVLSVASLDNEFFLSFAASVQAANKTTNIAYLATEIKPFNFNTSDPVEIFATSLNSTNEMDACEPLPDDTPDLSKKLVLIRRGTCTFQIKEKNVLEKGAKYIWFYNQPDRVPLYPSITPMLSEGIAMISAEQGEAIVKQIAAGAKPMVTFSQGTPVAEVNSVSGGKSSSFSEWGPAYEAEIKPEIAAPGGNIYSTYPLSNGKYAISSGTSMAAPYIAGIAALYIGKAGGRAKLGPEGMKELKNRIMASGGLTNFNNGTATDPSRIAPVAQQGAGYVNAKKVFYTTTLSPGKLELNDTIRFKGSHEITIKNTGSQEVTYSFYHEPSSTFNSFYPDESDPSIFPPSFEDNATATVNFDSDTVVVAPGASGKVKITFSPPAGLAKELLPVYSGKIFVSGTNDEELSIPYQGIYGDMSNVKVWNAGEPVLQVDGTGANLTKATTFTFKQNNRPALALLNHWGSVENRWDIVKRDWKIEDWSYPPVKGQKKFVGSVVDEYGGIIFPWRYSPRTDPLGMYFFYFVWAGNMADGTKIADGTYKMVISTLKPFGDPKKREDWEMKVSPEITVRRSTSFFDWFGNLIGGLFPTNP